MTRSIALLCAVAAMLTAPPLEAKRVKEKDLRDMVGVSEGGAARTAEIAAMSPADIQEALTDAISDKTKIIYQPGHGVYVEYSAPDGHVLMWYPRNTGVVHGEWGIRQFGGEQRICFKYFAAYHGVTGEFEPTECVAPQQTLLAENVIALRAGDAFGLASGKIPYAKHPLDLPEWPSGAD